MIISSRLCIGTRPFSPRLLLSLCSSSCSNESPIAQPSYVNVPIDDLKNHLSQILTDQGHSSHSANIITDTILYAELRNNNQGIVKVIAGALKPNSAAGEIRTVYETPVSCQIDGNQQIGMVVVKKCTDIAIQKAKISGVCIVGCSNYSSATGALGVWAR
jgi:LDH2 family malate/lactate/ureidoglycolate dehydrogenase